MKLIELEIFNITSFKGEHKINFKKLFASDSMLAITGPTGSGKSSILAAISIALYGSHYKRNIVQADLVTLGEVKGHAKLIFKVNNKIYQAIWECKVAKKNGEKLKTPQIKRILLNENGEALDYLADEVLKMSFEQYCRSVILNQGEFAKFLLAPFSERKALLDKLCQTDKLKDLSSKLSGQIKNIEFETSKLEEINEIGLPFDETVYKIKQKRIKATTKELNILRPKIQSLKSNLEAIQSIKSAATAWVNNHDTLNKYLHSHKDVEKTNLESGKKVKAAQLLFKESKELYDKKSPELNKAIGLIDKKILLNEQHSEIQALESEHIQTVKKLQQKIYDKQEKLDFLETKNEQLNSKVFIPQPSLNLKGIYKKVELLNKDLQSNLTEKKFILENIDSAQSSLNEKKQLIVKHKEEILSLLGPNNFSKTTEFISYLNDFKFEFDEFKSKKTKLLEIDSKIARINNHLKTLSKNKTSLQSKNQKFSKELKLITEQLDLDTTQSIIQKAFQIARENGECPVCGEDTSKLTKPHLELHFDINKYSNELKLKLEEDIFKTVSSLNKAEAEIDVYNDTMAAEKEQREKLHIEIKKLKMFKPNDLLEEGEKRLESLTKDKLRLKELEDQVLALNQSIQSKLNTTTEFNLRLKETIDIIKKYEADITGILNELQIDLPIEEAILALDQQIELISELENNKQIIKSHVKEKTIYQENISGLKITLDKNKQKSSGIKSEIENLEKEIQLLTCGVDPNETLKLIKLEFENNETKFRQSEKELNQIQKELKQLEVLIENAKNLQTSLSNQKRDILASVDIKDSTHPKIIRLVQESWDFNHDLPLELDSLINLIKEELIDVEKSALETEKESSELIAESKLYQQKLTLLEQNKSLLDDLQTSLIRKRELYQIIGRDEFRNYVLGLAQGELINFANYELSKLYQGRFELTQVTHKKVQDFYIIDHGYEQKMRKISTLSGGEIFIVSLALAFGLSELMKGQVDIESFFIDEGFGQLDEASLQEVLEALQNFKESGLNIGIISHIKALTSQIPINIKVHSKGNDSCIFTDYL